MKRALVTGGTKNDTAPIGVFVMNIKDTNPDLFDEIVIFHDGISLKDQKLINSIYPCRFIKYKYPNKSKNDEVLTYFSEMVFCKYECFKLLNDYDVVVWSDYDVVVKGSLLEVATSKEGEFNILTSKTSMRDMFYKDIVNEEILEYNLDVEGVGTPLFTLSRQIGDYNVIYDWCYEKTALWDADLYLPEQCIFGVATLEFNIKIKRFPFDKYACYPTKAVGDEIIIHAAGQPKFWNGLNNEYWNKLYKEWLSLGGSRYKDNLKIIKRKFDLLLSRIKGVRSKEHT